MQKDYMGPKRDMNRYLERCSMGRNPMVWKEELGNTQESAIYTSLVLVFPEYLLVAAVGKDNTELGSLFV